jgi:hypothetical protein
LTMKSYWETQAASIISRKGLAPAEVIGDAGIIDVQSTFSPFENYKRYLDSFVGMKRIILQLYICTPQGGEVENYKMANLEDYWKFLCCSHGSWFLSFSGLSIFVHLLGLQLILLSIIAAKPCFAFGTLTFSFFYFFGWQCCILPVWNPETEFA